MLVLGFGDKRRPPSVFTALATDAGAVRGAPPEATLALVVEGRPALDLGLVADPFDQDAPRPAAGTGPYKEALAFVAGHPLPDTSPAPILRGQHLVSLRVLVEAAQRSGRVLVEPELQGVHPLAAWGAKPSLRALASSDEDRALLAAVLEGRPYRTLLLVPERLVAKTLGLRGPRRLRPERVEGLAAIRRGLELAPASNAFDEGVWAVLRRARGDEAVPFATLLRAAREGRVAAGQGHAATGDAKALGAFLIAQDCLGEIDLVAPRGTNDEAPGV